MMFGAEFCYFSQVLGKLWMRLSHNPGLLCSPRLHVCNQKYGKNCNIVKFYYILK